MRSRADTKHCLAMLGAFRGLFVPGFGFEAQPTAHTEIKIQQQITAFGQWDHGLAIDGAIQRWEQSSLRARKHREIVLWLCYRWPLTKDSDCARPLLQTAEQASRFRSSFYRPPKEIREIER